eukprot:COSAG02_NODE_61570_length_268_cov_0.615385_1_plen_28_part_10
MLSDAGAVRGSTGGVFYGYQSEPAMRR